MFLENLQHLSSEPLAMLTATLAEATPQTMIKLQLKALTDRSPKGHGGLRQSPDALLGERIVATRERLRLQGLPDESLRWMIRQQLAMRAGEMQAMGVSGDRRLAFAVLRRIAPVYRIPIHPDTSPDWLEEEIFRQFIREMAKKAEEELRSVQKDPQKAEGLEKEIERRLRALSQGEQEALRRDLGLAHLTGRELRLFATRGGLTTGVIAGAASTGMGVYLATTTITHALATTLLGITVPFAAYSALMSTLSLVLSPVGALLIVGAGGFIQWRRLRAEVDRRVLLDAFVTLVQGDVALTEA